MSDKTTELQTIPEGQHEDAKLPRKSKSGRKRTKSKKKQISVQIDYLKTKQDQSTSEEKIQKLQKVSIQQKMSSFTRSNQKLTGKKNTSIKQQKQIKLNYFMKPQFGSSNSMQNRSDPYAITELQRRKHLLEEQLENKEVIINRLKTQKEQTYTKYGKLKLDHQQMKIRNKKIIQERMRQAAEFKRRQKSQINVKYGYYKQSSWTIFIEGQYIIKAKQKVQDLNKMILEIEEKKRNSKDKDRERMTYQIDFLKKSKNEAIQQLQIREDQVNIYKERLRLADKQAHSTFAKQNWPLINQRYLPTQLLGSGGFGQVYKCYDLQQNREVAMKVNCFQPSKGGQHRKQFIKHVQRQIQTLKNLNHPNIAKLVEQIEIGSNKISFVMQYCSGPELSKYLKRHVCLQEKQAKGIIKQLVFALKYMHQQKYKIIHYDLKPANIIFHHGTVKILDFGLCKRMQTEDTKIDLTSQGVGTYWYLPPETFKQFAEISNKVDVWSIGVIFYEMLYGKRPFGHGINQSKIFNQGIILKAINVQFPVQNQKRYKISDQCKQFIRYCCTYQSEQRPDPYQLSQHPYLK